MIDRSHQRFDPTPLDEARILRGLTIRALSERVGRSYGSVWYTLRGRTKSPRLVFALCAELDVPMRKVWR